MMKSAIRKHDKQHLVTVGLIPISSFGFDPKSITPEVDFISVHVYPISTKMQDAIDELTEFSVGKPLLIEEIFPMHCSIPELRQFLKDARKYAAGWIGFYWGKTSEEYRKSSTLGDAIMVSWLEYFQTEAKQ